MFVFVIIIYKILFSAALVMLDFNKYALFGFLLIICLAYTALLTILKPYSSLNESIKEIISYLLLTFVLLSLLILNYLDTYLTNS